MAMILNTLLYQIQVLSQIVMFVGIFSTDFINVSVQISILPGNVTDEFNILKINVLF